MNRWLHETFQTSCSKTQQFKNFARDFKKELKRNLNDFEIVSFNTGHFFCSGFLKYHNAYIYFSISDVRFFKNDWFTNILIRTAKHDKDYTGGNNNFTCLDDINKNIKILLGVNY